MLAYSANITPKNYHTFRSLQNTFTDKIFEDMKDVKTALQNFLIVNNRSFIGARLISYKTNGNRMSSLMCSPPLFRFQKREELLHTSNNCLLANNDLLLSCLSLFLSKLTNKKFLPALPKEWTMYNEWMVTT